MVLCSDNVLSSVVNLSSVDNKRVVITSIPLHELDTLLELLVVVEPSESGRGDSNDTARELYALALVTEGTLWLDNKAGSGLSAV